jgi:malate dehydrogenase (oxaloacetate-decarboxylating)
MGTSSASYSITMRVHLGADPLRIGRITTAVGEAAGTVVAVDIVESHPDLLVVDLTCNAVDAATPTRSLERSARWGRPVRSAKF